MRHLLALSLLASLAVLTACGKVRESPAAPTPEKPVVPIGDPGGGPGGPTAPIAVAQCTACHGTPDLQMADADPLVAVAPPRSLASMTDPGAHRAHLVNGRYRKAVECASCHLVPTTPPPHQAQRWGKVTFSRLATAAWSGAPVTPDWDSAAGKCSNTYCHGNFKNGAKAAPIWTAAGSVGCGSCHGDGTSPLPGGNHTRSTACGGCHDSAYSWNGTSGAVNLSLHMNGQLDLTNMTCTSCHGTAGRVANAGISGSVDANLAAAPPVDAAGSSTSVKVGVHQSHLNPTSGAQLFRPLVCADCHPDNSGNPGHSNGTIDVTLATIAGIAPVETPSAGTTAASCATYCHGAKWPAGDAHKGARTTWSWNGANAGCGDCHADPPTSTAHTGLTSASNCGSCHPGYTATTVNVALHINGVLDGGGGHPPGWKEPDQHGTGPSGALASGLTPCTTCHIGFGSSTGSAATSCDACHATPSAYGPYATGTYPDHADWKTECTFCHGGRGNTTGAPPRNTHVISSDLTTAQPTTDATIGAHASHVTAAHGVSLAFDCTACHATRWSSATDPGHVDKATADVVFNPVGATTNPGSYARPGCSSTYCHGNFAGGAGTASVQWTGAFGGAFTLGCASCHASPPALTAATHHPQNLTCASCHPAGASQNAMTGAAVATHVDGTVTLTRTGCTLCHGDLTATGVANTDGRAAPGFDASAASTRGETAATAPAVGAHAAHLTGTRWRASSIACNECHAVPAANDRSHATGAGTGGALATLTFGALARTGTLAPSYAGSTTATTNASAGACSNTYCHGGKWAGNALYAGTNLQPGWTGGAAAAACGTCHKAPPTSSAHASVGPTRNCGDCHTGYNCTSGNLAACTVASTHINGQLDVANLTCSSCHGDTTRTPVASATAVDALGANLVKASPPVDAGHGAASTGAHLAHVNQGDAAAPGALSNALACTNCHTVPASTGHSNGTIDVTFAGLSTTGGAAPTPYNLATHTCASTYCHGNFTGGAGASAIAWTGTAKLGCASCHGNPPPASAGHPQNDACGSCHGAGYSKTGATTGTVAAATHVNGIVDLVAAESCTSCHGTAGRPGVAGADANQAAAPPADTAGLASSTAVGAHLAHVNQSRPTPLSRPIACAVCHPTPAQNRHANGTTQVAFTGLAVTGGIANASYASPSCSATYCHGNFTGGAGSSAAPAWNVAGAQLACTSCHGAPPGPTSATVHHPPNPNCASCHAGYTSSTVAAATHVNGTIDHTPATGCTQCHGDLTAAAVANTDVRAAPASNANAVDAHGNGPSASATARGVGAHAKHLTSTTYRSAPIACNECHVVPASGDTTHVTGTASVAFGTLARTAWSGQPAITPTYATATGGCASTYCHGNFRNGANAAPTWTAAGSVGCGSCHGDGTSPLPGGTHPANTACGTCHDLAYSWNGTTGTVSATQHLNGIVDLPNLSCTSCHGTAGRVANAGITGTVDPNLAAAPPVDASGSATSVKVGVHVSHVNPTSGAQLFRPLACVDCHPNNTTNGHSNGILEVTLATIAGVAASDTPSSGTTPASCTTYCHGAKWPAGDAHKGARTTWAWNGANAGCGDCHADPPTTHTGMTSATNCGGCHPGYTATTVNVTLHINGQLDGGGESTGGTNCGSCHSTILSAMSGVGRISKHSLVLDVPNDDTTAWTGATLSGIAPASRSCVNMCHGDHPHDLTSPVVATHEYNVHLDSTTQAARGGTTRTSTTRDNSDFDAAATNGGLCASCHQKPIVAGGATVPKATFSASAHNYVSNTVGATTYSWQYTLHDGGAFQRNCTKCHASNAEGTTPQASAAGSGTVAVHYSDNASLLAGAPNPASASNTTAPAAFICYNCHGSAAGPANGATNANRSNRDVWTATQTTYFHPVNTDSVHDGATEATAGFNSGRFSGANRHASCMDCHNQHAAGPAPISSAATATATRNQIPAGSVLTGALGITFTQSSATLTACASGAAIPNTCWPATTAANYGTSLTTATLEYQVCFKCHTAFAFGSSFPTAPATGASGLAQTDLGTEFNPGLVKSGHPVVATLSSYTSSPAPKNLTTSQLLPPWNVNMGNQTMTCTDCHSQEATAPAVQGPHGSAVRFILAGTNKAWPYTVAGATTGTLFTVAGTNSSELNLGNANGNGLFCRNCHPQMNSTASNSLHTQIGGTSHGSNATIGTCVACHLRVPHGGKVSRLIVTTNAPARYRTVTPNFAQFTKNPAYRSYAVRTNASTSCSQHSATLTAPESW